MLRICPESSETTTRLENIRYSKCNLNANNPTTIIHQLAEDRNARLAGKSEPPTPKSVSLQCNIQRHDEILTTLRKHERLLDGQLGQVNSTEHLIDVAPDSRPFYQCKT